MFQASNVSKVFKSKLFEKDVYALTDVSFKLERGVATGFLGANGAGKTTFIKILLGFISPSEGKIVFGEELGGTRIEALKKIGYVPERPYYYQHLKGRDFLMYMGELSELSLDQVNTVIERYAERLVIKFALDREISGYSKGMLQRLGFLCALLNDPELLILDEPLSGLDPIGRRDIKDLIQELVREGKSIFISSHIIPDVEEVCEQVVCLDQGRLVYQGRIHDLLEKTSSGRVRIVYHKDNEEKGLEVSPSDVNQRLDSLIDEGASIVSVTPHRARLEEVVYKI